MGFFKLLHERVQRFAEPRNIGVLFVILIVVVILTRSAEHSLDTLDMKRNYSVDTAYKILGDTVQNSTQWTYIKYYCFDMLFAITLAFFQIAAIAYFIKAFSLIDKWTLLFIFPLIRGICDMVENASILFMLLNYPTKYITLLKITNIITLTKWGAMYVSMITVLVGFVVLASAKLRSSLLR